MNRVVVSVPRVLDSAVVVMQDADCAIATGNLPTTATAPFTVHQVKTAPLETQMQNTVVTPLSDQTNCARVQSDVAIPVTLSVTDANGQSFETYSSVTRSIDIVLYIPDEAAFPYTITSEGIMNCTSTICEKKVTTLHDATFRILTRVTAVTDLLIPTYGYAPLNRAENFHESPNHGFINQPLFPNGRIY